MDPNEILQEGVRYELGGALDRALERYRAAFDAAGAVAGGEARVRAESLRRQADVHRTRCDWDAALAAARASLALAEAEALPELVGEALNAEAAVHLSRGEFEEARGLYERILRGAPGERMRGIAYQNLGTIAARSGRVEEAEEHFLVSSRCFHEAGYLRGEAIALNNYAAVALDRGDWALAVARGDQAVAAARGLEDLNLLGLATLNRAEALAGLGDLEGAEREASASLGHFTASRDRWRRVECLKLLGDLARRRSDPATARRCFQAGLREAEEVGAARDEAELRERLARLDAEGA